jgi:osmotically-inducible protein OsmY
MRVAVVVAAALGATACSTPHRDTRTADERAQDQAIVERVKTVLRADPNVFADHIDVNARRGVVSLTGWAMSDPELRAVDIDVAAVPGVRRIDDRIEVLDVTLER